MHKPGVPGTVAGTDGIYDTYAAHGDVLALGQAHNEHDSQIVQADLARIASIDGHGTPIFTSAAAASAAAVSRPSRAPAGRRTGAGRPVLRPIRPRAGRTRSAPAASCWR
jgi:hypothetical protein